MSSSLLEPYKKPRPTRLPPYFYLLLAIALLAIPRPLMQLPTNIRVTATKLRGLPNTTGHLSEFPNTLVGEPESDQVSVSEPAPVAVESAQDATPAESSQDAPTVTSSHETPTPECGHIVLVSAARHGSTWLIDSAEGCRSVNGSYGSMNRYAELWNSGQTGPLRTITPSLAASYAQHNHSIKVFPPALSLHGRQGVHALFASVRKHRTPVFVLRRRLEDSYDSLAVAKETKLWNSVKGVKEDTGEREIVKDGKWLTYYARMEKYFKEVEGVMKEVGIKWDEVRYEDVIGRKRIYGETNGCYIQNCNFRRR